LKPIRNLLLVLLFCILLGKSDFEWDDIFRALIIAGAINSIVVLLQYMFMLLGLDDSILRFYPAGMTEGGLRKPGLSSGYPSSGMLSCISAITALTLFQFKQKRRYFLLALLCLPGVFLSARTAVVLFLVAFFILICLALFFVRIRFLMSVVLMIIGAVIIVSALFVVDDRISETFYIMFEFVFVYFDDGELGVRSTDDLIENHYFLPSSLPQWIFGSSKSPWGEFGIPSDVWLIQNLLGSGALVVFLYITVFLFLFLASYRATSGYQRLTTSFVFCFVAIASIKGSFIFSRFVGDTATLLGAYALSRISGARGKTGHLSFQSPPPRSRQNGLGI
jgi:hypothetical protein